MSKKPVTQDILPAELLKDIRVLIEQARQQTATAVNAGLTIMYWRIGQRIHAEVLGGERAAYGEQIVATLSRQLVVEYGRGYTEKNLRRMIQFAEAFPDEQIVYALSRQLSWSHFQELLPLNKPMRRVFFAEMYHILTLFKSVKIQGVLRAPSASTMLREFSTHHAFLRSIFGGLHSTVSAMTNQQYEVTP